MVVVVELPYGMSLCPLDDLQSLWRNGRLLSHKRCKNLFLQPTLCHTKRLTTSGLKTLHKDAIQKKTFTINCRDQSKCHLICRRSLLSAHHGRAGRCCYGATCLTWNRSIVKHLFPQVRNMPVVFSRAGGDPKVAYQKITKLTNTLHAYSIQKSVLHGHWLRISCQTFTLGQITTRGH